MIPVSSLPAETREVMSNLPSVEACVVPVHYQAHNTAPLKRLLAFLLVANTLSSVFTTISTKGRPVTDPRDDAAIEYVSLRSLLF